MNLDPWEGCEVYVEWTLALELNKRQVLFECDHGRYWHLGDRVLPLVYHVYPPKVIPINPYPLVRFGNPLTNDEVANARLGRTNPRIPGDYLEFIKTYLQGHLVDASGALVSFLFSQINLHHLCHFCHLWKCLNVSSLGFVPWSGGFILG